MPTAACPDLFVKKEGRARRLSEQETRSLAPALGFPGLPESRSLHRGGAPEQPGLCSLILHVAPPPSRGAQAVASVSAAACVGINVPGVAGRGGEQRPVLIDKLKPQTPGQVRGSLRA